MEDLTYEIYLADPRVRERLEREARRARAEAMYEYVAAPLVRMCSRIFMRTPTRRDEENALIVAHLDANAFERRRAGATLAA